MIESNREIWRYFQKVEKNRNLKFEIKIAVRLNVARKTKKTHMFSHFEKKRQITYKEEGNQERSGGRKSCTFLAE
jgi:hypothetical protein